MSLTLFVGDVHGCATELRRLLDRARADRVVLLGDLFTKGPDPVGVWSVVEALRPDCVLGNHDAWLLRNRWRRAESLPAEAFDWLETLPTALEGDGWIAVHAGIDPEGGLSTTAVERRLNLRRWPDDEDPANPFWWERYRGPPLVVHGHDAARGLNDHRPSTLGLDTGCVYGGRLTGYLIEEDRLLQVPAERVYKPIKA